MADQFPAWVQEWGALGGASLFTGVLGWWTSHRTAMANIRKIEAEAAQVESSRSADFEKALNERSGRLMDLLEKQIEHLSELVETQTAQIEAQSEQIAAQTLQLAAQSDQIKHMDMEIARLRRALDSATRELNQVQAGRQAYDDGAIVARPIPSEVE